MNDKLMKRLEKSGKKLSPVEKEAKMNVLKELSSQAGDMLGQKLAGLKKVTVASDSEDGLEQGLEKAKEIIEGEPVEEESEGLELADSDDEDDMDDIEDCSPEELEAKIQKLQEIKAKKLAQV